MKVFISYSADSAAARDLVAYLHELLRDELVPLLSNACARAAARRRSEAIAMLLSADAVVGIVPPGNPSVFFELGIATGAGIPTLIAARSSESLPAGLASIPYVQLGGDLTHDAQTIACRLRTLGGLASPKKEIFASAHAALHSAASDPALMEALPVSSFEKFVADFLKDRGFEVTRVEDPADTGVDVILRSPSDGQVILVQIKKVSRQSRVSIQAVRVLQRAVSSRKGARGILISTSGFTDAAVALAAGTSVTLSTLERVLAAKTNSDLVQPADRT